MSERIRVAVLGAAGRMGSTVVRAVQEAPDLELVAAVDAHEDLSTVVDAGAQVAVDFTVPSATEGNVHALVDAGVHLVVGTTGWDDDSLARVRDHLADRPGVGVLHREVVQTLGITPEAFLAAVRFSAFVRDAVGPGPVRPQDALAVLQWYLRAGYPPREVERFTGLGHVELRRLEAGIAAALGVAA